MKAFLKNLRAVARFQVARLRTASATMPAGSIVVVAPHPDDETFGCGGTISLAARSHAKVQVVFLSDGEASLSRWNVPPSEVAAQRRDQTVRAASAMGLAESHLSFMHLPDGRLPAAGSNGFQNAVRQLGDLLVEQAPDLVLCSHPADGWPDHASSAAISLAACAGLGREIALRHYTVWLWFASSWGMPGVDWGRASLNDVRSVLPYKSAAMDVYLRDKSPRAGVPWCGRLPWSLPYLARQSSEILFDA